MGNVNSIVKGIVAGLIFFVFGAVMFVHFGDGQRKYEAKLQSIRAGKVQPEVLTVTSKYNSQNRAGQRTYPHFVCSASRQARIVLLPPLSLYNSIKTGDSITGYYFPDGYLVPGWRNRTRIVNPEMLPPGKYDFVVNMPDHPMEAFQAEIKKQFGLVAAHEMRDTNVLVLTVANADAPRLRPNRK